MEHDSQDVWRAALLPDPATRVPHFDVTTLDGAHVQYADDIWRRRNLLLVLLPDVESPGARRYVERLQAAAPELATLKTTLVLTSEPVGDLRPPAALVADQWGEVVYVETPEDRLVTSLRAPEELVSWARYLSTRCPECEGEFL
jgi:hypothetical protein